MSQFQAMFDLVRAHGHDDDLLIVNRMTGQDASWRARMSSLIWRLRKSFRIPTSYRMVDVHAPDMSGLAPMSGDRGYSASHTYRSWIFSKVTITGYGVSRESAVLAYEQALVKAAFRPRCWWQLSRLGEPNHNLPAMGVWMT